MMKLKSGNAGVARAFNIAHVGVSAANESRLVVAEKLDEFASYRDGWAFGEGKKFSRQVLSAGRMLVSMLTGPVDVFPGRDGDLLVTAYRGDVSYDFIVDSAVRVTVVKENEDGSETNLQFSTAWREVNLSQAVLHNIASSAGVSEIKWNLLDSYTLANMNLNAGALRVQLSSLPALSLESLVSKSHAPSGSLAAFAFMP